MSTMNEDQREAWRKALAAKAKASRRRQPPWPHKGLMNARGGMIRIPPPQEHDDGVTTLPKCSYPGCPIRYRGGPDRPCPAHQAGDGIDGIAERMAQFAIVMPAKDGDHPPGPPALH
jgi:hypothetical protein